MGPAFPCPTSTPIHAGSRARSPKCPRAKSTEKESLHQAPKSHTKRVTYLYVLQESSVLQLSIPGPSSVPSTSHESGWPGRSPQFHQPCLYLLQADFQTDLMTLWQPDLQTSHSNFKCLAQNFLHDLTSASSYGALVSTIFVSFPVSLTPFGCHF